MRGPQPPAAPLRASSGVGPLCEDPRERGLPVTAARTTGSASHQPPVPSQTPQAPPLRLTSHRPTSHLTSRLACVTFRTTPPATSHVMPHPSVPHHASRHTTHHVSHPASPTPRVTSHVKPHVTSHATPHVLPPVTCNVTPPVCQCVAFVVSVLSVVFLGLKFLGNLLIF